MPYLGICANVHDVKTLLLGLNWACRTLNEMPNACKKVFRILKSETSRMGRFLAVLVGLGALGISLSVLHTLLK